MFENISILYIINKEEEDEKINLEMNFSFNLQAKKASLVEVKDGYSADLIAIIMK